MKQIAIHEAAHAVIAHYLGREVTFIAVSADPSTDAYVCPALTTYAPWPNAVDKRTRGERGIIISIAGGLAQARYAGSHLRAEKASEIDFVQALGRANLCGRTKTNVGNS